MTYNKTLSSADVSRIYSLLDELEKAHDSDVHINYDYVGYYADEIRNILKGR